jgi:hypothetical protein
LPESWNRAAGYRLVVTAESRSTTTSVGTIGLERRWFWDTSFNPGSERRPGEAGRETFCGLTRQPLVGGTFIIRHTLDPAWRIE